MDQERLASWNQQLTQLIERELGERLIRLRQSNSVASALSVPVRRAGSTSVSVPARRTRVNPAGDRRPRPFADEAVLEGKIYEQVLDTLATVCRGFERIPEMFARLHDEERVRDVLLVVLNTNYEGQAGAEVFNFAGKTDLLIRWVERNVFIGECKFWTGQKGLRDAVDQLQSYHSWRDGKAALLLFKDRTDGTQTIEKARQALRDHTTFLAEAPAPDPSRRADFTLRSPLDTSRNIQLALLPFVIPRGTALVESEPPTAVRIPRPEADTA